MGDEEEESPSENKSSDYMAEAQKHAGRLGQELRDIKDKMESDDIKYILNMVISAVDLDRLDDEDIEDIADKFDRDEEQGDDSGGKNDFDGEELGGEKLPAEEPAAADEELGEESNPMDALESFINSSIDEEYGDFNEEDMSGLKDEIEMDELNIADYADLDEEAVDGSMFDYKPDYVSPELEEQNNDYAPDPDSSYEDKFETDLEPEYGIGDASDEYFNDEDESDEDMETDVEIDLDEMKREINNNIHTTLSKYFK